MTLRRVGSAWRRPTLLLLLLLLPARGGVPVNVDAMNRFADAYNRYSGELRAGIVDVRQWARVEQAWKEVR